MAVRTWPKVTERDTRLAQRAGWAPEARIEFRFEGDVYQDTGPRLADLSRIERAEQAYMREIFRTDSRIVPVTVSLPFSSMPKDAAAAAKREFKRLVKERGKREAANLDFERGDRHFTFRMVVTAKTTAAEVAAAAKLYFQSMRDKGYYS